MEQKIDHFVCKGDLIFSTVEGIRRQCAVQIATNDRLLRVDLQQVGQCDSAGLALLIDLLRTARQYKKPISFGGVPKQLKVLAQFSGVTDFLPIED